MAEFPSLPLFTDAYIADTQHLTNEEHGVYLRLLIFAWRTPDCCLPNDDRRLATMVGVTPGKWAKLKPTILAFWNLEDGTWRQKKLTKARAFAEKSRAQKSLAGKASSRAKSLKNKEVDPTAVPTADPTAGQRNGQQSKTKTIKKEDTNVSSKKGTRLSGDWILPRDWGEWAISQGWPERAIRDQSELFRDHWISQPGQRGVKLDWLATWRNWMRRSNAPKVLNGGSHEQPTAAGERVRRVVTAAARGTSGQDWG